MNNRVITRERGVIPGCRAPGPDSHMAVDGLGRPWIDVVKLPSAIDSWLTALREETRRSRIARGADPETGIKIAASFRSRYGAASGSLTDRAHRICQRGSEAQAEGSHRRLRKCCRPDTPRASLSNVSRSRPTTDQHGCFVNVRLMILRRRSARRWPRRIPHTLPRWGQ